MKFNLFLLTLCLLLACNKNMSQSMSDIPTKTDYNTSLTYLALGDSYTIGEAVEQKRSFPYQLVSELATQNLLVTAPKIIAKTGWTTDELQNAIEEENINQNFDMVTLLIGVNNQYRGYAQATYRNEFVGLLQKAISFAGGNKNRVFVVSIPDWGITPFGKSSGKDIEKISTEIDAFNAIAKKETLAMGVSYTDITPGSRNADTDLSLVATDGLHPSGKMYAEWVKKVTPSVIKALK